MSSDRSSLASDHFFGGIFQMKIPGFQVYVNDPPKPKARPFDVILYKDGELLTSFSTDTDISDEAISSLVRRWQDTYVNEGLNEEVVLRLVEHIKAMRDARWSRNALDRSSVFAFPSVGKHGRANTLTYNGSFFVSSKQWEK